MIKGVDLQIADGEFVIFVGPSGCGKSTLSADDRGGWRRPRAGQVVIDGRDATAEPPSEARLAMVFQSYALYPHMSVAENMGFSLKTAGAPKAEQEAKVAEAARVLRLEPYLERRPRDLSGGQRQRVAIGRSIVRDPTAFLFDEPLSNLDARSAGRDALRDRQAAPASDLDDDLRDPRSGRGDDAGRPHRGAGFRDHRAGRHPAGSVRENPRTFSWRSSSAARR